MKESNLKKSPVIFNEDEHTYTLDGKTLSGVTPIVAWLFPETYKGIPESILVQAAQYGGMIHKKIELADSMGIVDDPLVQAYIDIKEERGVNTIANEFLVSDEKRVASSIDLLMEGNDIWDAKTTSKVHIPNVTIQTSIYAWLFEMQTGELAGNLYCLWLPKPQYGQPELIPLKRVSPEIVRQIVDIWANDGDYQVARALLNEIGFEFEKQRTEGDIPAGLQDLMDELIQIKTAKDQLDEREKAIKQVILSQMQKDGVDKMGNDLIEISRKAAYESTTVDTTALKKKMPEVFESFKKVTKVAERITYKVL